MGPICDDTIQNALRNLRPVPHPNNFPAESCRSLLPSLVSSPRSLPRTSTNSTTIEDLEAAHDIGIRSIEDAKELICYVEDYLQSVDFKDATKKEQNYNFQDTPVPCPENIYGWQTESYLNRGQRRHTNCIELDTDMTDRFIVELKPRKKKRGLLSRLKTWKKQSKSSEDVINKCKYKRNHFWKKEKQRKWSKSVEFLHCIAEMSRAKEQEREFLLEVIHAYRELPCLWKMKSSDYTNRNMKDDAYTVLLTKYRQRFEDATKEDLKKRLNSLRTNFRKELKKVNDSVGIGSNEVYDPSLWYFDAMSFLSDQEVSTRFEEMLPQYENTIKVETQSEDGQKEDERVIETYQVHQQSHQHHNIMFTETNETGKIQNRRKLDTNEAQDEMTSLACNRLHLVDDEYLTLAKTWANEISKMDSRQQLFAKKAINDIIFEGQCGTLHRHSVHINITPTTPIQHSYQ